MPEPGFRDIQYRFTAHMRDPERNPAPEGVEDRRLKIYRDLLYKNVEGFMANAFPVLRELCDDQRWHAMIRDYFSRHRARTGLFPRMPQEFLHYLTEERDDPGDPPFLRELAHYEWLEAEVLFDVREIDAIEVDAVADLLGASPVPNPVMRPQAYSFPVHRIGPQFQPAAALEEPTYLVVFRRRSDEAGFLELNAVSARLLELVIDNHGRRGLALLEQIAEELHHPDAKLIIEAGGAMLQSFLDKDIILGTVAASV